ncbi:MAG: (2Fe-2S)-binding protein [Bdellovibrionaceae bacterium]|nr:(2Fe-2S)-binding protein [Pseudobdellovibrionaceae bacterium]
MHTPKKKTSPIICKCNDVTEETIKQAIKEGCKDLNELFDKTNAGVGPCGGSCRKTTGPWLEYYLKHGTFPTQTDDKKKS